MLILSSIFVFRYLIKFKIEFKYYLKILIQINEKADFLLEWIINVNLWGVLHGIRAFIPIMLKQNEDCHIINTSSTAGLISSQFHEGIYDMTKHAVVALSEGLSNELSAKKSKIKVSVLCPGLVKTNLLESKRNSPLSISDREINFDVSVENFLEIHPEAKSDMKKWMGWWKRGISPEKVGEVVFKAIKDDVFYILTDNSDLLKGMIENRMKRILKALEQNEKYMK